MAASKKDDDPFEEATRFDPEASVRVARGHENPSKPAAILQVRTTVDLVPPTVRNVDPLKFPQDGVVPDSLNKEWAPLYLDEEILGSRSVNLKLTDADFAEIRTPPPPDLETVPTQPSPAPMARSARKSQPAPIRVKRVSRQSVGAPAAPQERRSSSPQSFPPNHPPRATTEGSAPNQFLPNPASSQMVPSKAADPKLIEGSRIGNYEVIRKIGQGGMGVVYEGRHLLLPRRVAIKFLLTNQAHDEEQIRRFLGEAVASAQIGHKGVVDIYDYGYDENKTAYLIMEFVDGQSLQAIMKRSGQLPVPMVVRVVRDIAEVLAAAHQSGIVHRDLKPDNIVLSRDEFGKDFVKILDFGVAKFVNSQGMSGQTVAGSILGTPWYMPPEQCKGLREVDFRSDIYALGCVFYQMLCGKVPFAGSLRDVLTAHIHATPTPPTQFNPSLPPAVEGLILRMMAKEPAARPASMEEVAHALTAFVEPQAQGQTQNLPPMAPMQPHMTQQPARSRTWLTPTIAAVIACVGTAAAFYFLQ